ncbi:DEAD/DEAH box helicase [Sphingobacterium rhinopitheci]|uniref:DEAD/DEAH box helicase n=1 Tax=Sphingobacterium rhinopitheci TaxID=2781960 RepID=UPI001F51594E|nr:DEAD/DEAH box helicase [Sphingobacterium rhinopitheci]MCI0920216.1 DEAD/DEAH box helicase [Sphingobacterium rhinopitheci]
MNPFLELGIREEVVKAISEIGFEKPSEIQEKAIPVLLTGSDDFVGLAQTGTGKTAAFGLPLLEQLDFSQRHPQALILCPTRELCLQISKDLEKFAKYMDNVNVVAVYGGANISDQLRQIRRGVQIVVATPGRMLDIIGRNAIDFSSVNYVVLDEADEMLNMGFQEDINNILSETPDTKKTWLFSATMPKEVRRIAQKYMTDPVELTVGTKNTGNANIEHQYFLIKAKDKYAAFKRIVDSNPDIFGIVFCRTKIETQEIAEALIKDGYNADALHGDLSQQQRDKVMKRYRDRSLQMLIATDVAARGIDVNDVTHVINFSLPDEIENYTHRSGRTARAGKTGISISLINIKEQSKIRQLEKVIGKAFERKQVPQGEEVVARQLLTIIDKVNQVEVNDDQMNAFLPAIMEGFESLSKEEIVKRFASLEFNRFLDYYKNAPDLNIEARDISNTRERGERGERGERSERGSRMGSKGYTRLFMNLGAVDEFSRGDMLGFICNNSKISGKSIGKIDMKGVFTFFEVQDEEVNKVFEGFKGVDYNGRQVRIEVSGDGGGSGERSHSGGDRGSRGRSGGFGGERRDRGGFGGERKDRGGFGGERKDRGGFGGERKDRAGFGGERKSRSGDNGGFRDFSGKRSESKSKY